MAVDAMFQESVRERHTEAVRAVEECIRRFVLPESNNRDRFAREASEAVKNLVAILPGSHRPSWHPQLANLLTAAANTAGTSGCAEPLLTVATNHYPRLRDQKWTFDDQLGTSFDFDKAFAKHRDAAGVTQAFDDLISKLSELVQCEELDSRKVVRQLEQLIATLKGSRSGSFYSVFGSLSFAGSFLKHLPIEAAKEVPVLKSIVNAAQKAYAEAVDRAENAKAATEAEIRESHGTGSGIEFHPEAPKAIEDKRPPIGDDVSNT